jgi:hypothetical protein
MDEITMCPKCVGTGVYYTKEFTGVRVNPCSCEEAQAMREVGRTTIQALYRVGE